MRKKSPPQPTRQPIEGARAAPAPGEPRQWTEGEALHIDVRGLPPPQPLVAILRLVRSLGDAAADIVVHHDRDPVLLYPELAEIGWSAAPLEAPAGEVRLLLRRQP
jgi:hypothetical protein